MWRHNVEGDSTPFNSSPPGQNVRHFGRRNLQMHFLEWEWQNFDSNFTEICYQEFSWQEHSIGSGNGLGSNRRQAITRTNDDPVHWRIYAALGEMSVKQHGRALATTPVQQELYGTTGNIVKSWVSCHYRSNDRAVWALSFGFRPYHSLLALGVLHCNDQDGKYFTTPTQSQAMSQQGLKLTSLTWSNFLSCLIKSRSKSDHYRSKWETLY